MSSAVGTQKPHIDFDCVAYNKTAIGTVTTGDGTGGSNVTTTYHIHDVAHLPAAVCTDFVDRDRKSSRKMGIVSKCCLPVIVGLIALIFSRGEDTMWFWSLVGLMLMLMFVVGPVLTLGALVGLNNRAGKHVSLDYLVTTFKSDIMKGRTESNFSSLFTFKDQVR